MVFVLGVLLLVLASLLASFINLYRLLFQKSRRSSDDWGCSRKASKASLFAGDALE
jgi:hypothetical protein